MKRVRSIAVAACAAGALVWAGCGGGGGSGGDTATVGGNVSSASTALRESAHRSWLAWVGEEVVGLARRAYAAAAVDRSPGQITVTVTAGGRQESTMTGNDGNFTVGGAPAGDVDVVFSRGNCTASVPLDDVEAGSTIDLQDVSLDCDRAHPGKVAETFQAVLRNQPASLHGNLNVCATTNGNPHVRAIDTSSSTQFEDSGGSPIDPSSLKDGDLLDLSGDRAGIGANSTLEATLVKRIGSGDADACGAATPTPTTPMTPTATPGT